MTALRKMKGEAARLGFLLFFETYETKEMATCHSSVRWCAPGSSDTLLWCHHTPLSVRYIHRVDTAGNPSVRCGSDRSVDRWPRSDTRTDLWPDRTAQTPSREGRNRTLQIQATELSSCRVGVSLCLSAKKLVGESCSRWQPSDPKPNVSGAQVSQQRPITLGLHSQIPPSLLQFGPREPTVLHRQAETNS